jgi:hypothetical protein
MSTKPRTGRASDGWRSRFIELMTRDEDLVRAEFNEIVSGLWPRGPYGNRRRAGGA